MYYCGYLFHVTPLRGKPYRESKGRIVSQWNLCCQIVMVPWYYIACWGMLIPPPLCFNYPQWFLMLCWTLFVPAILSVITSRRVVWVRGLTAFPVPASSTNQWVNGLVMSAISVTTKQWLPSGSYVQCSLAPLVTSE